MHVTTILLLWKIICHLHLLHFDHTILVSSIYLIIYKLIKLITNTFDIKMYTNTLYLLMKLRNARDRNEINDKEYYILEQSILGNRTTNRKDKEYAKSANTHRSYFGWKWSWSAVMRELRLPLIYLSIVLFAVQFFTKGIHVQIFIELLYLYVDMFFQNSSPNIYMISRQVMLCWTNNVIYFLRFRTRYKGLVILQCVEGETMPKRRRTCSK
jgi:hypothetical protein